MSKRRPTLCPECLAGRPCPMRGTKYACQGAEREPWRFGGGAEGSKPSAAERTLPLFKDAPDLVPLPTKGDDP